MARGTDHRLPQIGLLPPWPWINFIDLVMVGVISSDYCHSSFSLTLDYSVLIPHLAMAVCVVGCSIWTAPEGESVHCLWSLFTVEFGVSHGAEFDVSGNIGADVLGAGDHDGCKYSFHHA